MAATFPGVIAFAFMGCMLLLGTVLRARFVLLQTALVPASLIGGLLGFGLIATGWSFGFASGDFTAFAFHLFTLSFMSLCLTGRERGSGQSVVPGGMWLSVVWVMSLVMQALVGLGVVLGYNALTGGSLSPFLGMLVTHGFTQGPGQALALGSIWQNGLGIEHAVSFGLIYASVGFIVAFVLGVPIARHAIRAGLNFNRDARIDADFLSGVYAPGNQVSAGRQITHAGNVDSLAFHLGILGVAYLLTDRYLTLMQPIASDWHLFGAGLGLIFSHDLFFFHGLLVCVLLRALMDRLGWGRFIDDETQRRITGSAVDLMVVATIMSIQLALLAQYLVPIVLVCVAVSLATWMLCFGFGRRLGALGVERAITAFGCCCGSTGTGLLLLRILDPNLSTSVARELAFFNIAILVLGFHVLTLMAPVLPSYSMPVIISVYAGTFVLGAVVLWWLGGRVPVPVRAAANIPENS
ncbi:MAG: sodium/glutamate symporter [Pseudomonadales bacterium]